MVIFNRIEQLQILQYNLYSITLIYTNVPISTVLQGCAMDTSIADFFCIESIKYVFYVSLQSFMSCRRSFKELSFISYFLFIINFYQLLANCCPLPYLLPDLLSLYSLPDHSMIASWSNPASFCPMLQFTLQFLMLLSGWRCGPFFLYI